MSCDVGEATESLENDISSGKDKGKARVGLENEL